MIKCPPVEERRRSFGDATSGSRLARARKGGRVVADLVSLIRHTLRLTEPLTPFAEVVR